MTATVDDDLGGGLLEESLRERKKQATRRCLRAAALRLVAERGYAHVTVDDIAAAAEVSPRTFFNYFPSKEAAVFGTNRADELRRKIVQQPPCASPVEALRAVFLEEAKARVVELQELGGDPAECTKRLKRAYLDPDLAAAVAAHVIGIEQAIEAAVTERLGGGPEAQPYSAILAGAMVGLHRAVMSTWARYGGAVALEELINSAFAALSQGLDVPWDAPCGLAERDEHIAKVEIA